MTTEDSVIDYGLEAVVHIGAGRGRELKRHRLSGTSRIVLVDADRLAAASLRKLAASGHNEPVSIEVVEAAVAGVEKDAELRIYNLERVSSIREPSLLAERYPGLKVVRGANVKTLPASTLIEELELDPFEKNGLFVDTPGEERAILQRLQSHGLLQLFSHLKVTASVDALYEGAASAAEIEEFLREAGFELSVESDGEWRTLTARSGRSPGDLRTISQLKLELEQNGNLHERVEMLEASVAKKEAARASHEKSVIDLSKENARQKAEIDALKKTISELEANPVDAVDRKLLFDRELNRAEAQLSLLRNMLLDDRER